jgi:hypothetical protein
VTNLDTSICRKPNWPNPGSQLAPDRDTPCSGSPHWWFCHRSTFRCALIVLRAGLSGTLQNPIGLSGPKDIWLGKKIRVFIGEPIPAAGKTVDEMHRVGAEAVGRLLPPYREPAGPKLFRRWLTGLF